MKYGINLLLWTDHVDERHRGVLEMIKAAGYDGVEIPIFQTEASHYEKLGKWLDELGLERTAVTCRTADDNPISTDPNVRAAGVANMRRVLDCCQAAGMKLLCGPYHSAIGHFSGQCPTEDEWKYGVESMQASAEYAAKKNVMLGVEYLNRFECYFLTSVAELSRFITAVNHPNCRMMYDTFHANIEEKDIAAAIRAAAPQTVHVHISENDRGTPGDGHVPWDLTFDTLKEVKYDGWLMIEAFGLALPALAAATKIWRKMYPDEASLAKNGLAFMKNHWMKRSR